MLKSILGCYLLLFVISVAFGTDVACGPDQPEIINITKTGSGNIYSPGYKENKNYPNFASCFYSIHTYNGMYIRLKFNEMDIEVSDGCESDAIVIVDLSDDASFSEVISHLCGNHTPRDIVSKNNNIELHFQSNAFNSKKGFNITYSTTSSPEVCPSGTFQCRNRNCISLSLKCNGRDECGDGTDEEKCGFPAGVSECGNPEIEPLSSIDRIVGGQEAIPGSWPWMADLQLSVYEPNGHACGGSLINAQWVLSAAHCFMENRRPDEWRVHLGNHDKYNIEPYEQIRYVERIIIYDDIPPEKFESTGQFDLAHDMALLKLNAPVNITTHVRPVCLPSAGTELDVMTRCYIIGWGMTRGSGSSDFLKQAPHPIQPNIHCERYVAEIFNSTTMICAGTMSSLDGACHGDSGGPLLCKMDKKWYVFGVTSFGVDSNVLSGLCGLKDQPSIFNKVSAKISWIAKMISKYTS